MRQWMWLWKEWRAHILKNILITGVYLILSSFVFVALGLIDTQRHNLLTPILQSSSNVYADHLFQQSDLSKISQFPGVKRVTPLTRSEYIRIFRKVNGHRQPLPATNETAGIFILPEIDDVNYFPGVSEQHAKRFTASASGDLPTASISYAAAHDYGLKPGDKITITWSDEVQQEFLIVRIEPFINQRSFYVSETPALREYLIDTSPFRNNEMWYTSLAIDSERPEKTKEDIEKLILPDEFNERVLNQIVQTKEEHIKKAADFTDTLKKEEKAGEERARKFFISLFAVIFLILQIGVHSGRRKIYSLIYAFGMRRRLIVIQVATESFLLAVTIISGGSLIGKIIIENYLGLYIVNELFWRYFLVLTPVVFIIALLFSTMVCMLWLHPRQLVASLRGGR